MLEPSRWGCAVANGLHAKAFRIGLMPAPMLLGREHVLFSDIPRRAESIVLRLTAEKLIDRDRAIYLFELDQNADPRHVQDAAIEAKKSCTHRLPQINSGISDALYIGSSCATGTRRGTLRTRLLQHFLGTSPNTYSMALSSWTEDLRGGVTVSAWQYGHEESEEHIRESLLAIEDWLARERNPMLGRRGARS